jgi:hypothetical protein
MAPGSRQPRPTATAGTTKPTDKEHDAETRQEYQEALDELAGEVGQAAGDLEALAAATVQAILAAKQ